MYLIRRCRYTLKNGLSIIMVAWVWVSLMLITITVLKFNILNFGGIASRIPLDEITVSIDATKYVHVVDERFASVGIAPRLFKEAKWEGFDVNSPKVINMVKELSPAFLRVGGTSADEAVFIDPRDRRRFWASEPDWVEEANFQRPYTPFGFSSHDWMSINNFAAVTNMSLIFNFNAFLRHGDFSWDPSNAKKLLTFSSMQGYNNISFQLGNEPNSYKHKWGIQNDDWVITGNQLGQDFQVLKDVLQKFASLKNSKVMGPDINRLNKCVHPEFRSPNIPNHVKHSMFEVVPKWALSWAEKHCDAMQFLKNFLLASNDSVDAITLHDYPLVGRNAVEDDFIDPDVMDSLKLRVQVFLATFPKRIFWLGETGSASGGGSDGKSNRFLAGFLWLDKLGLGALLNLKVIIRWTLYHANYALIDPQLGPNPDYWLTVLYKRLVSNKVLRVSVKRGPRTLRLYAHCSKDRALHVTIFGMNVSNRKVSFFLDYLQSGESNTLIGKVYQYQLTALQGDPVSRTVCLNGVPIKDPDPHLPDLLPREVDGFHMEPFSISFWTVPAPKGSQCV